MLPSATAAAVTSATARKAGFTGEVLLGGFAEFIWTAAGRLSRKPNYGRIRVRSMCGRSLRAGSTRMTKAAECGGSGAATPAIKPEPTSRTQRRIYAG